MTNVVRFLMRMIKVKLLKDVRSGKYLKSSLMFLSMLSIKPLVVVVGMITGKVFLNGSIKVLVKIYMLC